MRLDSEWIQSVSQSVSQLLDLGSPPLCTMGPPVYINTGSCSVRQDASLRLTQREIECSTNGVPVHCSTLHHADRPTVILYCDTVVRVKRG